MEAPALPEPRLSNLIAIHNALLNTMEDYINANPPQIELAVRVILRLEFDTEPLLWYYRVWMDCIVARIHMMEDDLDEARRWLVIARWRWSHEIIGWTTREWEGNEDARETMQAMIDHLSARCASLLFYPSVDVC